MHTGGTQLTAGGHRQRSPDATIDLAAHLHPGVGVWWGQGAAEPTPLVHALLDQADHLGPIHAFCGLSWDRRLTTEPLAGISLHSYGALGDLRAQSRAGRLDVLPCHYSTLPRLFAERRLPTDVGFVQVSRPDVDGTCSMGVGADYAADAIAHTRTLIGEINDQMPDTPRAPRIPLSRFAATISTDRPLRTAPQRAPDAVDMTIARSVAELVSDRETVQTGVGPLPAAVLGALSDHRDLGIHSGIITTEVLALISRGAVTGCFKGTDAGLVVVGSAVGSRAFYDAMPDLPIAVRPTSYTHASAVLAQLDNLVPSTPRSASTSPARSTPRSGRAPTSVRSAAKSTSPTRPRRPAHGRSSSCARARRDPRTSCPRCRAAW